MVRVFHFSDTHLGHQQFTRTDEHGLNQREQDLYAAFHRVIDAAVAEEPDLVIHAGDLFDGVRPGNRALAHAMEGFLKLSRAGIPTVVIAGNHEHPKLRETGSPMRLFSHLPNIHVAYQGRAETVPIETTAGKVNVHAVPQCADAADLASQVQGLARNGAATDILVAHGSVRSIPAFSHAEFNELELEPAWFDARFDYVALGHYHNLQQVTPTAWYCGAPERASLGEAGQEKGFLDVRLGSAEPAARFRPLPTRPTLDLEPIDARGKGATEISAEAIEHLARVPPGAVVRLRLLDLEPSLRGALDVGELKRAAAHALHAEIQLRWRDAAVEVRGSDLKGLSEEWDAFVGRQALEGVDRERILAKARLAMGAP